MSVDTKNIRNVALIGHNGTGKTNLIEQMLFYAGVLSRAETVESGKTVSDYTDEEIQRKMSIHSSLASMEWDGKRINVLERVLVFRLSKSSIAEQFASQHLVIGRIDQR